MADAKGSSSSGGGSASGGQAAGHGNFTVGSQHNRYHRIPRAMLPPSIRHQNIAHQQYLAGMIHHPSQTIPVPMAPLPYVQQYTMVPAPAMLPPQHLHGQSQISQENLQDKAPSNNNGAAPNVPTALQGCRPMYNGSAFMTFGHITASSNFFRQNATPCSFDTWTSNNMPRNHVYSTYHPAVIEDHHVPPFHSNNHDTGPGFQTGFRVDQPLVPTSSPFPPASSSSLSFPSTKISNGPAYSKKAKKSDAKDLPIVFRSDMKSKKNDELDQTPASEPPSMDQNGELTVRFSCREYRIILCKELTNSDVGNVGRIVMPKRDAEAHLPALEQREGEMLEMDDFKLETTWNFKYRFWPNNKSRMYVLESAGGFVKQHGLQTGDILIIYKSSISSKFVVRGEKAIRPNAVRPVVNCGCKNELNNSEECGFNISLQTKKT